MDFPSIEWKIQPQTRLGWVVVGIGVVLISIYFYQASSAEAGYRYVIGILFLGWLIIYFSEYWKPILYLLMAVIDIAIIVFLLLIGYWEQPLDQAALLLTAIFLLFMVYLYYQEKPSKHLH